MSTNPIEMDIDAYRTRQRRLTNWMRQHEIDWVLVAMPEHVQYLTAARFAWTFAALAAISDSGHVILVGPEKRLPERHAADEVHSFAARWHSTMRNDQHQAACQVMTEALVPFLGAALQGAKSKRLGIEFSCSPHYFAWPGEVVDIEPALYQFRRRKDAEEMQYLRRAIAATEKMYERAREIIAPGVNELDVFNELQSVAVRTCGEMLTGTGNDYQCGARGGPPRDRVARAGELYILDLGPAFRGYFADNARTIAVSEPTQVQLDAWKAVTEVFQVVESRVKPGISARSVFQEVQDLLDQCAHGKFNHHLGHGIGLFPHEAPHLNPYWDDTFEVGDVFTAEPGVYAAELCSGLRIENDYYVTETGVERLTNFPLELML